jgi:hypothetical protein
MMLLSGSCGAQYQTLIDCGADKTITCNASGLPTVTGCTAEQDAFVACLNP